MIRIHFTAADFARVRFAPRPAPLQELNVALGTMCRRDAAPLFGRWRQRTLRALPPAAEPFGDLVPGLRAPRFLDQFGDDLAEGLESVRATGPEVVRAEIERVYAGQPTPAPRWVHGLHRGDADAWRLLSRARRAAFDAVLRPVWPLIQDLHHAEFTRHALTVAEHGLGAALSTLTQDARLHHGVWEFTSATAHREIELRGRGVVLVPTFHRTGPPLLAELPGHPLYVTYPAGPGLPLPPSPAGGADEALAAVLGRTRLDILLVLAAEHTTGALARRLCVSNATVSTHTAALRGAGLITTERAGRAVLHRRTPLGTLLVQRGRPAGPPPV
ncbi:ArsR/SmtB family transcription factor [Streptomyces sp. A1-5]|uniref:ArsR/SmtB family transcription factor n=1 Tax=Streptomyces sp. A1-5 TaxID=2738410 RepID=UPI001F20693A|nr:winged helix-turn-helix domain-containing protein [Streptomyces sp. A1-5]UJB40619.1 winged helix-turn-helix transcriptional regulator [Streptomyces sp. A1-5]